MIVSIAAAFTAWVVTDDWLIAGAVFVLGLIWSALRAAEGPPVLALAMSLQWVQVTIGLFYGYATGRTLEATLMSDYRPMVAIGLGCIVALVLGLSGGTRLIERLGPPRGERPDHALSFTTVLVCYGLAVAVVGGVHQVAWNYPSITQAIIALTYIHLGLLYLVLRRLVQTGRWIVIALVLGFEVALGLTGFYAGFREPLIMAVLASLEIFDRRDLRHWATVGVLAVVMCLLGVFWISVRRDYRERILNDDGYAQSQTQRLNKVGSDLSSNWASNDRRDFTSSSDQFVDRLWAIYYPALAIARVPSVLPHTNGQLMASTLQHVLMPRIFFPEKEALGSDSDLVRKYAGIWVAGEKEQTSIAFGYAAESYVDFGVPLMFVPAFVYGLLMGVVYAGLLRVIHHRDVAVSVATVIAWLSLYLFERSWAKTIGLAGTLLIYVGGLSIIFDQLWLQRFRSRNVGAGDPSDIDFSARIEWRP
jgi:hypothetical protein